MPLYRQFARRPAQPAGRDPDPELLLPIIMRHMPGLFACFDREGRYLEVNDTYCELLHLERAEVLGQRMDAIMPGRGAMLQQVLDTGVALRGGPHEELRGGILSYWDYQFLPLVNAGGQLHGALFLGEDATERVMRGRELADHHAALEAAHAQLLEAHVQLTEADQYKDDFLAVLSHELRTPLNFITGFGSILEDELSGPLNPTQREQVGKILQGADRMTRLVNDLLELTRLRAGAFTLHPSESELDPLIHSVVAHFTPLAQERELVLAVESCPQLRLSMDVERIHTVIYNLVDNAVKFSRPGGLVTIRSEANPTGVRVEVTDTGPGIAPAHQELLFEPFRQLDMSSTRPAGGTGVGLTIARALIQAHGGTMGITSHLDAGSTFWFQLPA